jgi:hypothetical protein
LSRHVCASTAQDWDADGSGEIERDEFRDAIWRLGSTALADEVDSLFDAWDVDGSGASHRHTVTPLRVSRRRQRCVAPSHRYTVTREPSTAVVRRTVTPSHRYA